MTTVIKVSGETLKGVATIITIESIKTAVAELLISWLNPVTS